MTPKLSQRLADIVAALPLKDGMHILEIGCGPGAMAREMCKRIGKGHVLAIDRSAKAIQQAMAGSKEDIASGRLSFKQVAIEDFEPAKQDQTFDLVVAIRVGALDGRHPELAQKALHNIAQVLKPHGKLLIDGGNPLREINLRKK